MKKIPRTYVLIIMVVLLAIVNIFLQSSGYKYFVKTPQKDIVKKKFETVFNKDFYRKIETNRCALVDSLNKSDYYDNYGCYYFIDSLMNGGKDSKIIVNPIKDDINKSNVKDFGGVESLELLIKAVESDPNGSYCEYKWKNINDLKNTNYDKIGFVKKIPELNWIIGASSNLGASDMNNIMNNYILIIAWSSIISIIFLVIIIFDILKLKRNKDIYERLSIVAKETENGITIMDSEGNLEWVNEGFIKMYGYNFDEFKDLRGENLRETSAFKNIELKIDECIQSKASVIYPNEITTKSGELKNLTTTLTPVLDKNHNILKLVAIDTDITKLKETEKKLFESKRIESLGYIVRGVSHELNGEIAVINDFIETINEEADKCINISKDEKWNAHINTIIAECKKANKQTENINDLLDSFKIYSRDQIKDEEVDFRLCTYLENTILKTILPRIKNKNINIKLTCDKNLSISGIKGFYAIIFTNLVLNSDRHAFKNNENGEISIKILKNKNDSSLEIIYTDNGVGIKKEVVRKIFEPFYTTTPNENSGYGLFLVKWSINQLGGSIHYDSDFTKGAKFIISIPIN